MPVKPPADDKPKKRGLSRVSMGILIALVFFSTAALGGPFWSLMVMASIVLGNAELKNLLGSIGVKPSQMIIYASAILMVIAASLDKPQFIAPIVTLSVMASFFRLLFRSPRAHIGDIGGTLLVIFYMVYLPSHFILLRHLGSVPGLSAWMQPGLHYLMMTLAVISASDIGAYYAGRAFGKHLLYPEISPKKTKEGAVAGLFAGILLGVICALLWNIPMVHAVVLSILLVIVGQLGDLTESMMKRDVGLKDSGALLASHGGFLDRADSYIFSGVVSYYYLYWLVLRQGIAPDVIHWFRHFGTAVSG